MLLSSAELPKGMKPFLKFLNLFCYNFCLFLPVLFSVELEDTLFSSLPFPRISFRLKNLSTPRPFLEIRLLSSLC